MLRREKWIAARKTLPVCFRREWGFPVSSRSIQFDESTRKGSVPPFQGCIT